MDISAWAGRTVDIEFNPDVCCSHPGPDGRYIDDVAIDGGCLADSDLNAPPLDVALCAHTKETLELSICDIGDLPLEWYLWEIASLAAGPMLGAPTVGES